MRSAADAVDDTLLSEARRLVDDERAHIDETLSAYDRFAAGVSHLDTDSPSATGATQSVGGLRSMSSTVRNDSAGDTRIDRVRGLFAETVRPYGTDDLDEPEPLLVTVREELGSEIALALSPSTNGVFSPALKRGILSSVDQSQAELRAMDRGLAVEAESLRSAGSLSESITHWLTADHPPLSTLGFEGLGQRHETLAAHRERCDRLAADRQSTIHDTTNHAVSVDLSQTVLVEYLYQPLDVAYPALSRVATLAECCLDRQRTVRKHLLRRP